MKRVVFEDELVTRLYPITVGRPAYAISCGSYRLLDLLEQSGDRCRAIVRPYLAPIQRADFPLFELPETQAAPFLLINARLVPSRGAWEAIEKLRAAGQPGVAWYEGEVAVALVPPQAPPLRAGVEPAGIESYFQAAGLDRLPAWDLHLPLFRYPHDVVRFNLEIIRENLEHRIRTGHYRQLQDGLLVAEGVEWGSHVLSDTRSGPIVVEAGASIGPYSYLRGPAFLGPRSRVIEHAAIKDGVSIGHTTKIGGEVEGSVIEAYTNKQHHGFLGHSYLGSWINLGAGTCNSDLKNTYGEVKMDYGGERVGTGMQFLGCLMGDYAKSAINTGIFTGKTIGACSMLYGFVTNNVPSFVNYARLFGQVTELPPEVMIATQRRMFLRRKVEQRACDEQLLRDMYEATRDERQLTGEPLAL